MARKTRKLKPQKRVTEYQKRTQRISRWRSFRRGVASFFKKGYYAVGVTSSVALLVSGWWWVHSGKLGYAMEVAASHFYDTTGDAGMSLRYVYLDGRKHASLDAVTAAIGLEPGDPILGVEVDEIKESLKNVPWILDARIERKLPDTLIVYITERQPVAIWQHKGKLRLVDAEGTVIEEGKASHKSFAHLMLVVGENAPEHMPELLAILNEEPELARQVNAAVRVGKRRWDISFHNGVKVKLPQEEAANAWKVLAQMERSQQVLSRNVRVVDMRLRDRVFIDLPEDVKKTITTSGPARDA